MGGYKDKKRNHGKKQNHMNELINEIKKSNSLKEVFVPEKYALPNGWADKTAKSLRKNAMNSSQLRKIFTQLKTIEDKIDKNRTDKLTNEQMNEILLIMPQIAYAKGRNLVPWDFYNLMKVCITPKKIKDKEDYKSFVSFYTSVIAYAKL